MSGTNGRIAPVQRGYVVHGVRIALGAPNSESMERLVELLPPGLEQCEPLEVDPQFVLIDVAEGSWRYVGPAGRSPIYNDLALVTAMLDAQMRRWVADNAPERVFVHAGVVAYRGRAIVIPGTSFSGKTSLVVELVRAGAEYYSDEYAIIDDEGLVHPYARPLSVRQPGTQAPGRMPAGNLGGATGSKAIPVGVILRTAYRPGATFHPERRSAGQGMLSLLANTSHASRSPRRAMAAVQQAAATALVVEGDRGDAAAAAEALLKLAAEAIADGDGLRQAPARLPRSKAVGPWDVGFEVYGARARVAVPEPDLVATIVEGFPRHSVQREPASGDAEFALVPTPGGGYMVLEDGIVRAPSQEIEKALASLRYELFYFATHHARDHLVISAATVAHHGRAIVLPGAPKSGKSVLLAALLRAGAEYYADDWTVFDPDGHVVPFATSFRLDRRKVWAADFGAATGEVPIPVGLIARVPYVHDTMWAVQDLPPKEGVSLLVHHAYGLDDPVAAMRIAERATSGARVLDGQRNDPDAAAAALLGLAAEVPTGSLS